MFTCNFCGFSISSIRQYDLHQYFHRGSKGFFECKHQNCHTTSKTYNSFVSHLNRCHRNTVLRGNTSTFIKSTYSCTFSNCKLIFHKRLQFNSHLYNHIRRKEYPFCPFKETCGSCDPFNTVPKLKNHFFRKHNLKEPQIFKETPNEASVVNIRECSRLEPEFEPIDVETSESLEAIPILDLKELSLKLFSNLYLTLESKHFVTKKAIQLIIQRFNDIHSLNVKYIYQQLNEAGYYIPETIINKDLFNLVLNQENGIFASNFLRKKFFERQFSYIAPVKIRLSNNNNNISFYYYVPILQTIKTLLNIDSVWQQCTSEIRPNCNIYRDILDGECNTKNPFFNGENNSIKIVLYQDSFEICNPLGSSRKKHKVVGVYMNLANLHPWHRSRVEQIQLVALFYEKDIKSYGMCKIFEPIIRDLKILENNGIALNNSQVLKGSVIAVLGDNLGSHQIGGFLETFQDGTYFCRYCYANDVSVIKYDNTFEKRTVTSYNNDVDACEALDTAFRGMKHNSVLNDLTYFHVAGPGLPPCIAHDICEGIIQNDLPLVINYLVKKKILSYDYLNQNLKNVTFSEGFERIEIPPLKNFDKLVGTASQNLYLLNILPFALINISDQINIHAKQHWEMILLLREICMIIFAFSISSDQIAILKSLIAEYLEARQNLFPQQKLKPKHHYLQHYPHLIRIFGPLRHTWTLRFESKHGYFKKCVKHCSNFKNVLFSLSNKHQLLQSLNFQQNLLFNDKIISDCTWPFSSEDFDCKYSNEFLKTTKLVAPYYVTQSAIFHGISYKKNMYICVEKNVNNNSYLLLKIEYIFINKGFNDLGFIGYENEIFSNFSSGLYDLGSENTVNAVLRYIDFEKIICVEPMIHANVSNQDLWYFKSGPLEYF